MLHCRADTPGPITRAGFCGAMTLGFATGTVRGHAPALGLLGA